MINLKKRIIFFWILLLILIILDIIEILFLDETEDSNKIKYSYFILALLLFPLSEYIFYLLLFYKKPAVIVSLWDILSLTLITTISVVFMRKKYNKYEIIGIVLGFISSYLILI